jgi:phage baseplate assembly protein gpV
MQEIKDLIRKLAEQQEELYSLVGIVLEVDEAKRVCRVRPLDGSAELFDVRLQSSVSSEIGIVVFPKIDSEVTVTFISKELAYVSQTTEILKILLNIGAFSLFIDEENIETTVKNSTLNADDHKVNAKNAIFTLDTLFKIVSAKDITLEGLNINLTGITGITGPTTITGILNVSGAVVMSGGAAVTGGMSVNGGANGGVPLSAPLVSKINALESDLNTLKGIFTTWSPTPNDGGVALKALLGAYSSNSITPTTETEVSNTEFTQ